MDNCPAATAAGSKSSNILLQKGRRRKKYTIVLRESSKRSVQVFWVFSYWMGICVGKKNLVRFEPQDWMVNWIQPRSVHIAEIVCDSKMWNFNNVLRWWWLSNLCSPPCIIMFIGSYVYTLYVCIRISSYMYVYNYVCMNDWTFVLYCFLFLLVEFNNIR